MKAYKGLTKMQDGTLQCREFKYEVGKTYTHDGEITICKSGFHACHELHQVWQFYPNDGNNVFYEVECGGEIIESNDGDNDDGKFVCSEITLLKEVDVSNVAKFGWCWCFNDGFAPVGLNDRWNYINAKGEILSDQWFDVCGNLHNGFARVKLNDRWNYINTKGEYLSDQWFDDCYYFSEGFAVVKLNGKWNYINTKGELISDRWFDDCWDFTEGFGVVKINDGWNYINAKGEILSDQWFDFCYPFHEGFARVRLNGKLYRIDKSGKLLED